jgi:hypothetical protein
MQTHVPRRSVRASGAVLGAALSILSFQADRAEAQQAPVNVGPRWACRPADAGHSANVSMTIGKTQMSVHCTPLNVTITTNTGRVFVIGNPQPNGGSSASEQISATSPAYSASMTASDLNNQYIEMIEKSLSVDEGTTSGTMNVGDRWVCRPTDAAHPQNAVTTDAAKTPLSCRAVNLSMRMSTGQMIVIGHTHSMPKSDTKTDTAEIAPPSSAGLTPEQMAANWNASIYRIFDIATSAAGGG